MNIGWPDHEDLRAPDSACSIGDRPRRDIHSSEAPGTNCTRACTSSSRGRHSGWLVQPLASYSALAAGDGLGLLQADSALRNAFDISVPQHDYLLDALIYRSAFRTCEIPRAPRQPVRQGFASWLHAPAVLVSLRPPTMGRPCWTSSYHSQRRFDCAQCSRPSRRGRRSAKPTRDEGRCSISYRSDTISGESGPIGRAIEARRIEGTTVLATGSSGCGLQIQGRGSPSQRRQL